MDESRSKAEESLSLSKKMTEAIPQRNKTIVVIHLLSNYTQINGQYKHF